jgi:phage-related minor tail protein
MNSAIDNFVTTGKFKFSDFARSIIQDLIKIQLKAQASKILAGAEGAIGGFLKGIFGFANGGQPPVGKPSIVGENGPELFVPKTAGTIIPNGGGNGGNQPGGNTYITNNISAIDAKSVAQLFAENRKTLFGSVQLAQKEMSYGR